MTYEYNSHTLYIDNDTNIKKTITGICLVYESTNMNNEFRFGIDQLLNTNYI